MCAVQKKAVLKDMPGGVCGDCAHVSVVTSFHTLSVTGNPTLGRCPYYTGGKYCVLLSQRACEYFKTKKVYE